MSSSLLAKVCGYYYRDQLTMSQVGERLNISRHRVGRMLKEAVDTGFVRIEIRAPLGQSSELEQALESRYSLKSAVVAAIDEHVGADEIRRATCQAGAGLLREMLGPESVIGIGWGSTTYELVNQFEAIELPGATVVQITGGNKRLSINFDCHEVTRMMARRLHVQPVLLHAPGVVDRPQTRQVLRQESSIAETFRVYDDIDIALIGIGDIRTEGQSTLLASGDVDAPDLQALLAAGAAGDVFSYFITERGEVVYTELYERLLTIELPQIRKIRTKIGVAVGAPKALAVRAALLGGFVNTLVIDQSLAKALLALPTD